MAIDIFVQRGSGNKQGEDIVDPLITSIPVALQRGRNELDEQSSAPQDISVEVVYRDGVRLGQVAKFYDAQTGLEWLGKITGITHRSSGVELLTTLQVKKPTNFE